MSYLYNGTYMATLGYPYTSTEPTAYLSHVHHPRNAHHLQHPIVMGWLGKLVLSLWPPRIGTRPPATKFTSVL